MDLTAKMTADSEYLSLHKHSEKISAQNKRVKTLYVLAQFMIRIIRVLYVQTYNTYSVYCISDHKY